MDINAAIIDQRIIGVGESIRQQVADELGIKDPDRLRSLSFLFLCVKTMLELDDRAALDCLTDGGGDFGVDAMHLSEEVDGEFAVTLVQAKYAWKRLDGAAQFEANAIDALIRAVRHIFDPSSNLGAINERLLSKVEEARSLIRDGLIPKVRVIACSNGQRWAPDADVAIQRAGFGAQVSWEYVNHDVLVALLQRSQVVNETLRLQGKAIVEDLNFSRVCIGRLPVTEVANLMRAHGDRLLERNIRRYLGLHGNRINEGIRATLVSSAPSNFYFFNNGLTLVCSDFDYNGLQGGDYQVRVRGLQIVNGGQTSVTIFQVAEELAQQGRSLPADASVLVRLYKLPSEDEDLFLQITHATNSQNPVDLKDLRANDALQQQLEQSVAGLDYTFRRKRADGVAGARELSSGATAEAVLAVWRQAPHQAKFLTREHFGKLYEPIFHDLNGAQAVLAVLLYRIAENHRRRPQPNDPPLVRYASCFIAMQMGRRLLAELGLRAVGELNHRNFAQARELVEAKGERSFQESVNDVQRAILALYGGAEVSLQQLSATFRRGDLIQILKGMKVGA
jgi:hypothetical protein